MASAELVIQASGLTKRFGQLTAVDDLNLRVRRAEVFGFLGPNGSGKSTTIRMLCGLLLPSAGEIEVLGCQIPRDAEALKRRIGYMTQKFSLYEDLSVVENLQFLATVQGLNKDAARRRIAELLERYWLGEQRLQMAGTLSGGQKQRLALAGAVLHKPACCCSTNPPARSIHSRAGSSGSRCSNWPTPAPPCWSPPTTWTRPSAAPAWASSIPAAWSPTAVRANCSTPCPASRC